MTCAGRIIYKALLNIFQINNENKVLSIICLISKIISNDLKRFNIIDVAGFVYLF